MTSERSSRSRYTALAVASALQCGERKVTIGFVGDVMRLTPGDPSFDMRPVASAWGSKYEAVGDPSTTLWTKGSEATVAIKGVGYPTCTKSGASAPFRATGNEPGWRLDIGEAEMTFLANDGKTPIVSPTPAAEKTYASREYVPKRSPFRHFMSVWTPDVASYVSLVTRPPAL